MMIDSRGPPSAYQHAISDRDRENQVGHMFGIWFEPIPMSNGFIMAGSQLTSQWQNGNWLHNGKSQLNLKHSVEKCYSSQMSCEETAAGRHVLYASALGM